MVEGECEIMEAIGGYFEVELHKGEEYHKDAISLNTARNCFEYILLARNYKKVYIPYYTCEVMLQPLEKHHISYEFYSINELLEPIGITKLLPEEAFLYTNYFGLKQSCVEKLVTIYGTQLIVDNAQAFFASRIDGIDTFYSPRKFLGVSDGGYLYTDCCLNRDITYHYSYMRMQHLLQRIDEGAEQGYISFRYNDDALDYIPISKMSRLTCNILCGIDYEHIKKKRIDNFNILHEALLRNNLLNIDSLDLFECPMVYPYYVDDKTLRKKLIDNRIYIATYWPNVLKWCSEDMLEYELTNNIIALPIDQRYGREEMDYIIKLLA